MTADADETIDGKGLPRLEARLREDLAFLCHPGKDWTPARDGVSDVVIIGGGMCGLVAWLALWTGGVSRTRVLDRSAEGREGPWLTYARMETLRSPKTLTGPAFGHGALTFQAWHRAQFGASRLGGAGQDPAADVDGLSALVSEGSRRARRKRRVGRPRGAAGRLAAAQRQRGGRDADIDAKAGLRHRPRRHWRAQHPGLRDGLPRRFWAHSADEIDFARLKGKRVAVIGVGASAVDNAAEALEHGAAEVRHLIRRKEMPTINKMMGIGSYGFTAGYAELPDAWRWRFMQYSFATQTPPPHGSTLRVSRHPNAYFHFGKETTRIDRRGDAVEIGFADGSGYEADFVILGTGFNIDPMARTEFGDAAGDILLWKDVYTPPPGEQSDDLGNFPYLNGDFTFREKTPGRAPWLSNVYCFNYGASASMGKVSGDIPGVSDGAAWLARAIAAKLYAEDVEAHWRDMQDYDKPELTGEEWTPTELEARLEAGRVA
jgi:cation diffusion facilitator CzcD-associated flavoprotein CzcO